MVGLFAGLKWRLVRSRVRTATGGAEAWVIVGWGLALVVIVFLILGCFALRTNPAVATTVVVSLFTVQMVSWVLAPLVAFGIDETVDPARFALLPLTGLAVVALPALDAHTRLLFGRSLAYQVTEKVARAPAFPALPEN